jgi:hypothetical protein
MTVFQPPATRPQLQQPASAALSSLMQAQFVYIKRGPAASSLSPLYAGQALTRWWREARSTSGLMSEAGARLCRWTDSSLT